MNKKSLHKFLYSFILASNMMLLVNAEMEKISLHQMVFPRNWKENLILLTPTIFTLRLEDIILQSQIGYFYKEEKIYIYKLTKRKYKLNI